MKDRGGSDRGGPEGRPDAGGVSAGSGPAPRGRLGGGQGRSGLGGVLALAGIGVALAAVFAGALRARGIAPGLGAYHAAREGAISAVVGGIPWPAARFALGQWLRHALFSPPFFLATAAILLLEWARPANPAQPVFSPSFAHDLLWYFATIGGFVVLGAWLMSAFRAFYQAHFQTRLGFLAVGAARARPVWLRLAVGIVIGDLLAWFHHFVRHKVRLFWMFHEVHHGQRNLNAWTNERVHVVDVLIAASLQAFPLLALGITPATTGGTVIAAAWYTRLYHANVRGNFGVLRYLLVTPQSHRLHHSLRPEHQDKNFGVILSVWDRLFGTLDRDADVYPETGVVDPRFPIERGYVDVLGLRAFVRQQVRPFWALGQALRRMPSTTGGAGAAVTTETERAAEREDREVFDRP